MELLKFYWCDMALCMGECMSLAGAVIGRAMNSSV